MRKRAFKIPRDRAHELLSEAILEHAFHVDVDMLDGKWTREPTEKPIFWVLDHILKSRNFHLSFIERDAFAGSFAYFDVGCSMLTGSPEYFLWIRVSIERGEQLIEKYKLEQMQ
jgi:hypothetical protein